MAGLPPCRDRTNIDAPEVDRHALRQLIGSMYRTSRAVYPRATPVDLWRRAVLFCQQWTRRDFLQGWYLGGHAPELAALREAFAGKPDLVSVLRRPYINTAWNSTHRLLAVEEHYRQVEGAAQALHIGPSAVARLATVPSRVGDIDVVLDSPIWFMHEGELALNLFHAGERVYTVAFSLGRDAGEPVALIGALQGLGSDRALDLYRSLTHGLHGLRPRDLLIAALRILCRSLGFARFLAIGDAARVSVSPYFDNVRRLHASYDAAWLEHGGVPRADGFFALSVDVPRRTHADIPARKRSLYRHRYEMLDRLEVDMRQSLQAGASSREATPRHSHLPVVHA